jgi:hypothetical protein
MSGVSLTEDTEIALEWARVLLARFTDKVRLSCAEHLAGEKDNMIKELRKTNESLTTEISELKERIAELQKPAGSALRELETSDAAPVRRKPVAKMKPVQGDENEPPSKRTRKADM